MMEKTRVKKRKFALELKNKINKGNVAFLL